jgi:hypothetical protein
MINKVIGALLIGLVAYGVISCELSDREKKRIKDEISAKRENYDNQLWLAIIDKKNQYQADLKWLKILGFLDKERRYKEFYTSEIQDAFLIGKPSLLFGSIKDVSNFDDHNYQVKISFSSFKLEMMSFGKPTMEIEVVCNKSMVDKLLNDHAENYKKIPGFGVNIAVISNLKEVFDFSFKDSEGDDQKGKKIVGDCKEILLAPQGFGMTRKKIQELNF